MEAWVYPLSVPATGRACILDNNEQFGVFIYASGQYRCSANNVNLLGGSVETGTWTHITCTAGGGAERMYLNGGLVAHRDFAGPINTINTDPMILGTNSPSGDEFEGYIDAVRVWSAVRSDDDICWAAQP